MIETFSFLHSFKKAKSFQEIETFDISYFHFDWCLKVMDRRKKFSSIPFVFVHTFSSIRIVCIFCPSMSRLKSLRVFIQRNLTWSFFFSFEHVCRYLFVIHQTCHRMYILCIIDVIIRYCNDNTIIWIIV